MKYPDNIEQLNELPVDFMGMIFYDKSPRFVDNYINESSFNKQKVGVFVNADMDSILEKIKKYELNFVQLHGNESPEFCKELSKTMLVIKAFSVANISDLEKTKEYEGIADYFLFDTKTPDYGGSGKKFDWDILNHYNGDTPFFLSGGISLEDGGNIKAINHPKLYAVDLNSKFENEPGLKNIELLEQFIKTLRDEQD